MKMRLSRFLGVVGIMFSAAINTSAQSMLPRLQQQNTAAPLPVTQLIVNDKPFLILGGELGNSTASDLRTLGNVWPKLKAMHLNTVLIPVYWDLIEPVEGQFDFSLVQGAIEQARVHNMRIVFLWFGTWKNSQSCYAPSWVKRDTARFPRARRANGEPLELVAPSSLAAREADATAFSSLMRWLKQFDGQQQTVLMVQVENEIGMIPDARDHSPEANTAFAGPVPNDLMAKLAQNQLPLEVMTVWEKAGRQMAGSWEQVFGTSPHADELFSAWQFSTFVEEVTSRGKREYPLPMFANAALIRPNYLPGQYPSAGPLPHLREVYRTFAPSLDFIAPDIYFPNFSEWADKYAAGNNILFVPEAAASARAAANAVYAIGQHKAMGFSPFAVEDLSAEKSAQLTSLYSHLETLAPLILQAQAEKRIAALAPPISFDWKASDLPQRTTLGAVTFEAKFDIPHVPTTTLDGVTTTLPTLGTHRWDAPATTPRGAVMILQISEEEFIIFGMGTVVTFTPTDGKGKIGIDSTQEGHFDIASQWQGARWLNGDQTHQGRHIHLYDGTWTLQRVKLYRYE